MSTAIPAELREAAGRAAHATALADPERKAFWAHVREPDPIDRPWPDLTEVHRESFRAVQDPALSLLAPLLAECAAALAPCGDLPLKDDGLGPPMCCAVCSRRWPPHLDGCPIGAALARLAALGVRP